MCGLFGMVGENPITSLDLTRLRKLIEFSERRGSDASGFVLASGNNCKVWKSNSGGNKFFKKVYQEFNNELDQVNIFFGHTRLSTHGINSEVSNNQPVRYGNWIVVHNGIVTNYKQLSKKYDLSYDLDSITIPFLLYKYSNGIPNEASIRKSLSEIEGEISIIALHDSGFAFTYTNVGNIFIGKNNGNFCVWTA